MDYDIEDMRRHDVVLLCGISGSGKTTLARQLEQYGYTRLSLDGIIWERYGDAFAGFDAERRRGIFMEGGEELRRRLETLLRAGARVVVDATMCKRAAREAVGELCSRLRASVTLVFLDVDCETLAARLATRRGTGPDDQIVTPEELDGFCAGFERP